MIEHIVVCRLLAGYSAEDYAAVIAGLEDLVGRLPGARRFTAGLNRDFERKSVGFDAGFAISFADERALDRYARHPEHQALGARLVALCEGGAAGIMVFDLDSKG